MPSPTAFILFFMKKISISRRLDSFLVMTAIIISSLLSSCSGDKADVSELLSTVPADASAVVAVNVRNLAEKAGCKIEGSAIVPGKEVEALFADNDSADIDSQRIRAIFNGDAGIDPTVALAFLEGNELYITGFAASPDKFREFVKNEFEGDFQKTEDVETLGNVALKGNQFWIHASHRNDVSAEQIKRFVSLNEKLSFLSNAYSEKIASFSHDIEGWANISSLYNASGMSFQQKAMAGMGLAVLFSDAQDIAFHADFLPGQLLTSLSVLNSKGAPAKFNLPTDRIDVGLVKNLGESADNIIALAISPKLIEQLQKDLGDKNIPGMDLLAPALSALDGTSVIEMAEGAVKGVVSTKGEATAALSDLINETLNVTVTKDGKLLRFEQGEMTGNIRNAEVADRFKGAMCAMVTSSTKFVGHDFRGLPVKDIFSALIPSEGSMSLEVTVSTEMPKENFLLTFIKSNN